jgi:chaperone BCS1
MSASPVLVASSPALDSTLTPTSRELWPEPLDTPGLIPHHLKQSASASFPILEVLQRLLQRLGPQGSTGNIEKVLAIIGLYQTVRPVYNYMKEFFFWACTVQITVADSDPVAREILAWMGSEIIRNSHTRSAMLVTGAVENMNSGFPHPIRFAPAPGHGDNRVDEEVSCLPPLGTRLFW